MVKSVQTLSCAVQRAKIALFCVSRYNNPGLTLCVPCVCPTAPVIRGFKYPRPWQKMMCRTIQFRTQFTLTGPTILTPATKTKASYGLSRRKSTSMLCFPFYAFSIYAAICRKRNLFVYRQTPEYESVGSSREMMLTREIRRTQRKTRPSAIYHRQSSNLNAQ
jgi:hypothetical protein